MVRALLVPVGILLLAQVVGLVFALLALALDLVTMEDLTAREAPTLLLLGVGGLALLRRRRA